MTTVGTKLIGVVDKNDDLIASFEEVSENDRIIVISSTGKCYRINLPNIQGCDAVHKGTSLLDALGMAGEAIKAIKFDATNEAEYGDTELMLFTSFGIIKSSLVEQYRKCKNDSSGIILSEGDSVCFGMFYDPVRDAGEQMIVYTKQGMVVAWDLSQVNRTERNTKGTRYLSLGDDKVIGVCDVSDRILILTKKGYGKICNFDDIFASDKRKPKLQRITKLGDGDELFQIIPIKRKEEQYKLNVYFASGKKEEIMVGDIKHTTRLSRGFKLIKLPNGESIVKVKMVEI